MEGEEMTSQTEVSKGAIHGDAGIYPTRVGSGPLGRLLGQFGRPSGLLGRLAGLSMAQHDQDDRWVVDLLEVQPTDRVLEVGFGPGVAVKLLAARATAGLVAGVDHSEVMVRQARGRNQAAVQAGRVELRPGSVSALPYPAAHFTKALSIHTLYFWPSLRDGLRELHRVLAPGGRLVLAVRMQRPEASRFNPSRYGYTDEQVATLAAALGEVGFQEVSTQRRELNGQTITALLARR
jgi:ubiquinone/menaquinone biosynthesis C-methylase UbiE